MNGEKHLEKAKRIDESQKDLNPKTAWEAIIEIVYGAAFNYIAYLCEKEFGEHMETNKGLARFLEQKGLHDVAELFRTLDHERVSKWYGGQDDGDAVRDARKILKKIKARAGIE
jgi:hypothetical protein